MKAPLLLMLCFLFSPLALYSESSTSLQFQLDTGWGIYIGDFKNHLEESDAWTHSPILDFSILIFPWEHWGIGVLWGSMMVAHEKSEPIEGIIRYYSLISEYRHDREPFWGSAYTSIGYQDPGMTLDWYASGFFGFGCRLGWKFRSDLSLTLSMGYRRSFFRSIIIHEEYDDIDKNDNLSSLRASLGLRYEI